MPPVPPLPFSEAIYNHLPAKDRKKLAQATRKQSAFSSASLLSNTLKNPAVVKALPKDVFGSYINKSGQIKWWTRLKLTLRHFYHALFSNYAKLSKDFAKLVERLCKGNASKANGKEGATTRKEATSSGPGGNRGTLARDFALNMGAAAAGNVVGNQFHDWRKDQKEKKAQAGGGDGGDSAVDKTGDPEDADKLRSHGREDQDEDVRSDSGDDVSEADDDAQSDAGSHHDHDDGADNDGADSGGGWFSWPWGGDGDGDGGGGD